VRNSLEKQGDIFLCHFGMPFAQVNSCAELPLLEVLFPFVFSWVRKGGGGRSSLEVIQTCSQQQIEIKKERNMKKSLVIFMAILSSFLLISNAVAADKAMIQGNVDGIVADIDGGKAPTEFKADDYDPYAFIMEQGGNLVVHPSLAGQSLKEKAGPVYDALLNSTPGGTWVDYEWQGKQKHSYVKTTQSGLIVGSGYSD
jgi:hypothetical protein